MAEVVEIAAATKSLQSCPTLWDPIDGSPPGSPVPGILQARTLQWVAISFSNAWKGKVKVKSLGCVWLLVIPWTADHQAPPFMGFSRQEYWSGLPLSSPVEIARELELEVKIWPNYCHITIKLKWVKRCFLWMSEKSGLKMESTFGEDAVKILEMTTKFLGHF